MLHLSADEVCTWPVAPLGEAKWLWRFSWYRNNRQQRFVSSGKRCYTNADIITIIIIIIITIIIIIIIIIIIDVSFLSYVRFRA